MLKSMGPKSIEKLIDERIQNETVGLEKKEIEKHREQIIGQIRDEMDRRFTEHKDELTNLISKGKLDEAWSTWSKVAEGSIIVVALEGNKKYSQRAQSKFEGRGNVNLGEIKIVVQEVHCGDEETIIGSINQEAANLRAQGRRCKQHAARIQRIWDERTTAIKRERLLILNDHSLRIIRAKANSNRFFDKGNRLDGKISENKNESDGKMKLTEEQKLRIHENKLEAIERARLKREANKIGKTAGPRF